MSYYPYYSDRSDDPFEQVYDDRDERSTERDSEEVEPVATFE
jgi:hypothetical protein